VHSVFLVTSLQTFTLTLPDEAAVLVRALLTADKNQHFTRTRMTEEQRKANPAVNYRPFIIADADTGHGGDAHVRNLIRRFVEAGIPGYHIEDQKPGAKKCGHQGGKVLVAKDEQIRRLNAARFQLDIMRVPGIIVARTDAEAATFLDNRSDERDQPFILGATNTELPSYRIGYLAILRMLSELGLDVRGHLLFAVSETEYKATFAWLSQVGLTPLITETARRVDHAKAAALEAALDQIDTSYMEIWQRDAGLKTYGQVIADVMKSRQDEGERYDLGVEEWLAFSRRASFQEIGERAKSMGIQIVWDCELPKTPEGFYQIQVGSTTPLPNLWRLRRLQTSSGWKPRQQTWRTPGSSRKLSTPSVLTKCWPTICRRRSTGIRLV
jgi:isocitrate lyase